MFYWVNNYYSTIIWIVGCILISHIGMSQDYNYLNWTTHDGLPSNYVYGVLEDHNGLIWAYTENGIARFDGYEFKTFNVQDGLPTGDIVFAVEDRAGKIWCWGYNSPISYIQNDSVYTAPGLNSKAADLHRWKNNISFIANGMMYCKKFDSGGHVITKTYPYNIYSLEWRSIDDYAYINPKKKEFIYKNRTEEDSVTIPINIEYEKIQATRWLQRLDSSLFFYSAKELLYIFDIKEEKVNLFDLSLYDVKNNGEYSIETINDKIMISNNDGFVLIDKNGKIIERISPSSLTKKTKLKRAYLDSKNNIWIGSRSGGLFMIPAASRHVELLPPGANINPVFEKIFPYEDGFLALTENIDAVYIDTQLNVQTYEISENTNIRNLKDAFLDDQYFFICSSGPNITDTDHNFYDSNINRQIVWIRNSPFYNPFLDSIIMERNMTAPFNISKNSITGKYYWTQTNGYSFQFDGDFEKAFAYPFQALSVNNFEKDQHPYFSSSDGTIFKVIDHERPLELGLEYAIDTIFHKDEVGAISSFFIKDSIIFLNTRLNGFYAFDLVQDNFLIHHPDILNTHDLKYNKDHQIFLIPSSNGLYLLKDTNTGYILSHLSTTQGLISNEVSDAVIVNDLLYVATYNGINYIPVETIFSLSNDFQSRFKKIILQVSDEPQEISESIKLKSQQNNLSLDFGLLSYESNKDITYYTKLEPLEDDWVENSSTNVNFLDLNPGSYTFTLKAEDIYGNVNLYPEKIKFKILKPWYATNWFLGILILSFLLGLWKFISYRDKAQKRKLSEEKRINKRFAELEMDALRAQMNPHFIFNALGAIQYFINTNDIESADNYLTRFALLMRKYLDSSKEKMITLEEEISLLRLYTELEKVRFEEKFIVNFDIALEEDLKNILLPSMMIQPYVENAINHGLVHRKENGELKIQFFKERGNLFCEITDNGIGRTNSKLNKSSSHISRGMKIIQEKIETLRKSSVADIKINIEDLNPNETQFPGTKVQIEFHIPKNE